MNRDLKAASNLAQAGRYVEAIALYRNAVSIAPDDAEANHFLGVCLVRSGSRDEGFAQVARSVRLAPGNALYRQNYALLLAEAGRLSEAERELTELIALHPRNPQAHNYLGMVRQQLGRFDEALAHYGQALRMAPGDAAAANNLGYCLLERGDVEGARHWLQRAIAADPRNALAHNNLGNALRTSGNLQGALESYRRAIALMPHFGHAHYNLALTLRDLGEPSSLTAARAAIRCAPEQRAAWQLFAELLAPRRFNAWDAELADDCERLFSQTEVEVQDCAEAVLSLVRAGPPGRLFLLLLEHALVADEAFEREMTALRRELLFSAGPLEIRCAMAHQCFLNEYLWRETDEEAARLSAMQPKTASEVATFAMYRPIRDVAKPHGGGEAFERLWRRLVEEPAKEAALAIPALTPVRDAVSCKVRAQYEANPYPRWHRSPVAGAFPLPRMLRSLFPHIDAARLAAPEAPEILIAGCGTGRHAAITAQLQPHGRILAVDLSRASLAYAMRRCAELGLRHVRFAQADILELAGWHERFDLIECSGVLHHMDDPLAGWRVLLSLLNRGGFMKLGLYSEAGRSAIVEARKVVAGLDVRQSRERIFALPGDHPARAVTSLRDFYSASGARDLILHVQEHRYTIPRLADAIAELGVEFLGFELPGKRLALSLEEWDAYETANPDTFASMYQFWVRKS